MKKRAFIAAITAALMAMPVVASAQTQQPAPRIVVVGEGESTLKPDIALLSLSVMREAATAREAMTANNDAMSKVIAAMKESGVADRDLQTSGIQIAPRYNYTNKPDGTQDAQLVAYQVTNTISVRVRNLAKTGELIDKSVTLGVNQGGSITFLNEDAKPATAEARKKAVVDAMEKAKTLAEAAGVTLGRVIEMSELNYAQPPIPIEAKAFARDQGAAAAPVEAGENAYRVQVNMTFELR